MKKILILSLLVCIWSPLTFAARGSYTDVGVIKEIKVNTEVVEVKATVLANDEDCEFRDKFILEIDSDKNRDIYSTIIAAKAAERLVHFQLNYCSVGPSDYPKINQVFVH